MNRSSGGLWRSVPSNAEGMKNHWVSAAWPIGEHSRVGILSEKGVDMGEVVRGRRAFPTFPASKGSRIDPELGRQLFLRLAPALPPPDEGLTEGLCCRARVIPKELDDHRPVPDVR